MTDAVLGIDVGSGSARAGVFTPDGAMLAQASRPIAIWRPRPGYAQQSSTDIWGAVCAAVREAVSAAGTAAGGAVSVRGLGFDATCSLVLADAAGAPVSVDPDGAPGQDVVMWMDHRAGEQAERINDGNHDVLRYVGGRISLEMQAPKLLWLSEHLPDRFAAAASFFDLPDWLTWRATGSNDRSNCSTVCKWTYLGHEHRWDAGFFRAVGLGALADEGFRRVGTTIRPLGDTTGRLSEAAAAELGLPPGLPVGTSAIDAHAGGIGTVGVALPDASGHAGIPDDDALLRRLALVGGTSSCHMAVSREPRFVPGVWGPYAEAMVPGFWLNEGGQSAVGSLIDHTITTHPAFPAIRDEAERRGETVYQRLNARLDQLARDLPFPALLTEHLHVVPDHHGNRSPRADPDARGVVSGLSLSADADDLARLYLATVQGLAYGTRHIVEAMNDAGYTIDTVLASGGGTRNPVFLREHADATGCRVVLPREPEAVLLGAAILGAVSAGLHPSLRAAMAAMSAPGATIAPATGEAARFHEHKYRVFRRMIENQRTWRALMTGNPLSDPG